MTSPAQLAYEEDVRNTPNYLDGTPRPSWSNLSAIAQWSWERLPVPRAVHTPLPAVLYLLVLDNLGDAWEYGKLHAPEALEVHRKTLDFATAFPSRATSVRASIRLSA